jgi:hypothetical protein
MNQLKKRFAVLVQSQRENVQQKLVTALTDDLETFLKREGFNDASKISRLDQFAQFVQTLRQENQFREHRTLRTPNKFDETSADRSQKVSKIISAVIFMHSSCTMLHISAMITPP